MTPVRLQEIVDRLGGDLVGDGGLPIDRIGPPEAATPATLSFIANARYRAQLETTGAGCMIVAPALREAALARQGGGATIVTPDPYLYFARLTQWWAARSRAPAEAGVHPSAVVEPGARIHPRASVGALCFIGAGAEVGEGAVLAAQVHVGRQAGVGAFSRLAPRVVLGDACTLGERCIVQPGVVIGGDGFGFAPTEGRWEKIEQLGAVRIGNDVDIGANTCIDRGALDDTVIEDGVKLDNLIQIAHNVHIGKHTAMAGFVGVAGSTRIGAHCTFGGGASIIGHIVICDHANISACTVITRSILTPGHYSGFFPFDDNAAWEKNAATLRHLHALRGRVMALEKKIS